jgi:hypothetical protein
MPLASLGDCPRRDHCVAAAWRGDRWCVNCILIVSRLRATHSAVSVVDKPAAWTCASPWLPPNQDLRKRSGLALALWTCGSQDFTMHRRVSRLLMICSHRFIGPCACAATAHRCCRNTLSPGHPIGPDRVAQQPCRHRDTRQQQAHPGGLPARAQRHRVPPCARATHGRRAAERQVE